MTFQHITIPNAVSALAALFEHCAAFAEAQALPADKRFAVEVCVEEIVTNIIKYGYPEGVAGEIRVGLASEAGRITIQIEDEGVAFDPTQTPEVDTTVGLHERPIGGLGIHMVKNMMQEVHYERLGTWNRLTMSTTVGEPG